MTRLKLTVTVALNLLIGLTSAVPANDWFSVGQADVCPPSRNLPLAAIGYCNSDGGCEYSSECNGVCDLNDCCGSSYGGWIVAADLLFMQYQRNNTFDADTSNLSYNPTPRVVVGYQNACGLGVRMRFWDYDHSAPEPLGIPGATLDTDTFNIDLEAFKTVQLTDLTTVEFSGGIRYNDFRETLNGLGSLGTSFTGIGGIAGVKARCQMLGGAGYVSVNGAIIKDDQSFQGLGPPFSLLNIVTQTELGAGYEWATYTSGGARVWLRAGYEWWIWTGYGDPFGDQPDNSFVGFVLGGGVQL